MRTEAHPHIVQPCQKAIPLKRVKLDGQEIREDFLQQLLDSSPAILPVSEFDESFGPIISLGREVMGIDNLFISPNGRLTVVETKLWRNPQATRQVLAQILEYASCLAALGYEEFEKRCAAARQSPVAADYGLYRRVAEVFPDEAMGEAEFIDRLQKNLRNGRFLLLVVGDGIREGLENILDALHQQSRLHFTFGLVELQLYRQPDSEQLLAIPSVVAHSTEIERAVVTVRGAGADQVDVEVRTGPKESSPRLTEQEFLESIADPDVRRFGEILFKWGRQRGWIQFPKGGNSASIRIPFAATRAGLILIRLFRSGRVYATPPRLRRVLKRIGIGEDENIRLARELQEICPAIQIDPTKETVASVVNVSDLLPHMDELLQVYDRAVDRLSALDTQLASGITPVDDEDDTIDEN